MTLGQKIREIRRSKNWTQKELAEKIGMTTAQISRWEQDHVTPRTRNLQDLARTFDVAEEEFQDLKPAAPTQLFEDDPELLEIVTQINTLNPEQKKALKLVLHSMVTCQKLQDLAGAAS
jgi:transcriptional regulator with XRE-family HTH domain